MKTDYAEEDRTSYHSVVTSSTCQHDKTPFSSCDRNKILTSRTLYDKSRQTMDRGLNTASGVMFKHYKLVSVSKSYIV
jgi:hypothetical protein